MSLNFCTIASGSSGNSVFASTDKVKILIDAGLSGVATERGLRTQDLDCAEVDAIFITHEHTDHIRGAGVLSRRYDLPIYATAGTWRYLDHYNAIGKIAPNNRLIITPSVPLLLEDMEIMPFDIPHDASQPVGYTIKSGSFKIAIATDLGHISDNVARNIHGADIIFIESNHDLHMLENGPYPVHLKRRILSNVGHLSNASCGRFLADIFCHKTKHIFLGHLSEENNRPILAYETVSKILLADKIDIGIGGTVGLSLADRYRPSRLLSLT